VYEKILPLLDEMKEKQNELNKKEAVANYVSEANQLYSKFAGNVSNLFNNLSNQRIANYNSELQALDAKTQREIQLAGDNDEAKKAIEADAEKRRQQLEKKRLQEQQRQAKFNKAIALTQATINTAQGVTAALAEYPPNLILAALVAAFGAVEIAAISSQPIPQYYKGVESHAGGFAKVGEQGSELVKENGRWWLTPSQETLVNLAKGSTVIPHEESMQILATNSIIAGQINRQDRQSSDVDKLIRSNKRIEKAIYSTYVDIEQQGTTLLKWRKAVDGSRSNNRKKSMGDI